MEKFLLEEDDCAPDALDAFVEKMEKKFGLIFNDFKKLGTVSTPDDSTIEWRYSGYILSFHGDDPYHKLEKEEA